MTIVELGLVAPFLVLLLAGCIDLGRGLSERYALQQAAHRTIELANSMTLAADKDANEIDFGPLKAEAAAAAGVPESAVTLTRWVECNRVVKEAYNIVCPPGEMVARYIQLEIVGKYVPMLKLAHVYPLTDANGEVTMTVEAAVRIQ
ncbi:MAG TPA: TadE/TadG family type IV pilus assembly protein [Allosphingosinicella sp.]